MRLKKYMEINGITQGQAAQSLGIERQYLNNIANDKAEPGRKLVERIVKWSDGDVQTKDLPGWSGFIK